MNKILLIITAAFLFSGCNKNSTTSDAFGNFEADETMVSSEMSGKILWLSIEEGKLIDKNQTIGLIDTIMPALQLIEIEARHQQISANLRNIDAQLNILKQQKENLQVDFDRLNNMKETGAATQKQIDDASGGLKIIDKQIEANATQKNTISKEFKVLSAKKLLIEEQLNKCHVSNPIKGTVLEKYAETGEITAAGKPLYKIADMENIILRAYVSGGQLHAVSKGITCKVLIDKGNKEYLEFEGTVIWISSNAEFTPKIIQTKEERVSMVYAVKILVKNDGSIKIGMPGEVVFSKQ